jgi:hypothetical protein
VRHDNLLKHTEVGVLFRRFENALSNAHSLDARAEYLDTVSGRRLREAWDAANLARNALLDHLQIMVLKMEEKA